MRIPREPLADIAGAALLLGHPPATRPAAGPLAVHAGTPAVADVWISGDLGFVLFLHRRDDGLLAEELYYSVRSAEGAWERPDHLGGGVLGREITDPAVVEAALAGAPMSVVAASESLIHTGRDSHGDEAQLVCVRQVLVSRDADLIEVEHFSPDSPGTSALSRRDVTGPRGVLMLIVLLPGERVRVSALRTGDSGPLRLGESEVLRHPER